MMIGRADASSGASVTLSLPQLNVHQGTMYETSYKTPDGSPLADNDNVDFLFQSNENETHFAFGPVAANPIEIIFYEATTVTGVGTSLSVVPLNRIRPIGASSVVYLSPTVLAEGNILETYLQVWGLSPLTAALPEVPWILKRNTDYLIRIINRSGSAQDVGIVIQ